MGRALIIILAGTLSFLTLATISSSSRLNDALEGSVNYFSENQARNIANSIIELQLTKLGDSTDYRLPNTTPISLFGGSGSCRVKDTTVNSKNLISIKATGNYFGVSKSVSVLVEPPGPEGFKPPAVKAAISTNNPVTTLGNLIVDGREHDLSGNFLSTGGTLGLWTTSTYQRKGNSKVGGTTAGVNYSPAKSYEPGVVQTNQVYPGGYPNTPDSVLGGTANGFPPGTLKNIAQSGVDGSQYTTNPSTLMHPLSGVTYVELADGASWISADISGSGILIVHNSSLNAVIKNLNFGPFTGLLIADDIDKIHTDIIGAVIALSPAPPSGNCIGNGSGNVLYSTEAIEEATGTSMGGGKPNNYGYASSRLKIHSWYE